MESKEILRAEGLVKAYKSKEVVKGVSMTINQGEIIGLLGPNGAGKTTSFYMIVGLVKPNAGQITFNGKDISQTPMYQRARLGMGYLAQDPSIFRRLTVENNIMAIMETLDMSKNEKADRLNELLDEFGLQKVRDQKAMTLSGGERRRLEIARALVTNPEFILLDEPFAAIDPIAVHDIQQVIHQLRDRGLSILITDHSVRETLDVVDRAYIMYEGKILCEGDKEYLINDPKAQEIYLGPAFN